MQVLWNMYLIQQQLESAFGAKHMRTWEADAQDDTGGTLADL